MARRSAWTLLIVGFLVGCSPTARLADDVLPRQLDALETYRSADDVLSTAQDNRAAFDRGVEAVEAAHNVAGFVDDNLCAYLDGVYATGASPSVSDITAIQGGTDDAAANAIVDGYAAAPDRRSYVYGACMAVYYFGSVG